RGISTAIYSRCVASSVSSRSPVGARGSKGARGTRCGCSRTGTGRCTATRSSTAFTCACSRISETAQSPGRLTSMDERYIPTLDGWRAVAILLVIGDHLVTAAAGSPSGRTTLAGQLGVNIFFGLSGFLITSRLLAERTISLRRFYLRRVFRILP